MKILASLIILGLCANVCLSASAVPVASSQSVSSSALNSTAVKVYTAGNSTDAAVWNPNTASTAATQVNYNYVYFGPGSDNTTSYVWAVVPDSTTANNKLSKIIRRSLNNTLIGYGNDTTSEAYVTKTDDSITCTTPATSGTTFTTAVGPGYFAVLSTGSDGATTANQQVYVNVVTGTTATQTKLTTTTDVTSATVGNKCTTTTFGLGNMWYDIGAGAFFYTYWKSVATDATAVSTAGTCGGGATTAYTVYVGGIYLNSTKYWSSDLSIAPSTAANAVNSLMGGIDNWLNSSYIYVVYKDTTATTPTTYVSKTAKATSTTTAGTFSSLVADVVATSSVIGKTFVPIGVWASNYTYGIAVSNKTQTAAAATTYTYMIGNYLNGSTTYTDSGLTYSSATGASNLWGWPLTTGYTLVGAWSSSATGLTHTLATFYANGTANGTQSTLGTLQGAVSYYEDNNGTMWMGWQDIDSANSGFTYAGWLAKLQGQINVASTSSGKALTTLFAFVALCLASIFAF